MQVERLPARSIAPGTALPDATYHGSAACLLPQAESGAKANAELRQQLAASQRAQQAQALAAAAAAGESERLRAQLQQRDGELGQALAERADLTDAVDSLRRQVAVLKAQAGRAAVLRSVQPPLGR